MRETEILKSIQIALSKAGARLLRNNVGTAWNGQVFYPPSPMVIKVSPGDVVIRRASIIHFGLCVGSSDLIGWVPTTVTKDMVGKTVAVFSAVEVKNPDRHKRTDWQKNFIEAVQTAGGIAFFATSPEEALSLLRQENGRN